MQCLTKLTLFRYGMFSTLMVVAASAHAQEVPQPSPEHKMLAKEVGVWDADVSMWLKPDAEPMKSKAVETNALLGSMWLASKFEGDFGGEKFTGHGQNGYDPIKKKYVGTWIDSMSPFLMVLEGDFDEKAKTLTMTGAGIDHETGQECTMKMVTHYKSDNSKVFEMFKQAEGDKDEWQKTMQISYTRRK